jgi:AraC-like DNA-binding protein
MSGTAAGDASSSKIASRTVAEGAGWHVADVRCCAGPNDRPFEERHADACIAVVMQGTFQYRSPLGAALFAPGAVLLGNSGTCFTCGHEHGTGDRSLAFHYAPARLEAVVAAVPSARRLEFTRPRLAPTPALAGLLASAEAARDDDDPAAFEEVALELAAAAAIAGTDGTGRAAEPSRRDVARVTHALRRIEETAEETLSLDDLASEAAMSPYHFLRTFRRVAGMTPHQYVLRTRLHRAAVRLRRTDDAVSTIAFDAGFGDLSTFNRRFRRIMGASPSAFRWLFLHC